MTGDGGTETGREAAASGRLQISNRPARGWSILPSAVMCAMAAGAFRAPHVLHAQSVATTPASTASSPAAPALATTPPQAKAVVDHQLFNALLKQYVRKGFVDYDGFAKAPEFVRYLASLNQVRLEGMDEDERLAFWINVYNAYTIQLIISHHETESIRQINKSLGVLRLKGPWSEPLVHAAGRTLSLDDVHHRILRKEYAEPRVHFVLVCGAMGCPPLRGEAYTGAALVDQLNEQAKQFLRDSPTKIRFDKNRLLISPILMAYRNDFGASRNDLARSIAPWFDGEERKRLERGRVFLEATDFDWTLNSVAKAKARGVL